MVERAEVHRMRGGTSATAAEMRNSAEQLRAVLEEIDAGTLKASGRQRAFIAGAMRAVKLMQGNEAPDEKTGAASQVTSGTGGQPDG